MSKVSEWRLSEVGFYRLDEYVCGVVAKSSRNLSRLLNVAEESAYGEVPTVRDAVWLSYIRLAVSILLAFVVFIVVGLLGSLVRDSSEIVSISIMGLAFFVAVLRGQLATAAGVDLMIIYMQSTFSRTGGKFAFIDLYRKMIWLYPLIAFGLVFLLFWNGNLAVFVGL